MTTIGLGMTLRCYRHPRHFYIVLNNPSKSEGRLLLVNLSSLNDQCIDDECVLNSNDYPLLSHETTVVYSRHQLGSPNWEAVEEFQLSIDRGEFAIVTPIPKATLRKVIEGGIRSNQVGNLAKKILKQSLEDC